MNELDALKQQLAACSPELREAIFKHLRQEFTIHPLETELHAKAEVILEAIHRAGGLTLRMIRGVIAEAAFDVEVVERLKGWRDVTPPGDLPFDFELQERRGKVRVQIKLQRSVAGIPMRAKQASRHFSPDMYVVETQKTRKGIKGGKGTRPYRFGEFDVLAVAMYPSTCRWDTFMYSVAAWLLPSPLDASNIRTVQPVAAQPNDDWTDSFHTAVQWLRSRQKKTIRSV